MKVCIKCGIEKEKSDFHKDRSKKDGLVSKCKACAKEYQAKYYKENRERLIKCSRKWYSENIDKARENKRASYWENRESRVKQRKDIYWKNREENIRKSKEYHLNRQRVDPFYRFKTRCRKRVWAAFNEKGYSKKSKTFDLVGCSQDFLVSYIESKFSPGMSWENYGDWHVDHIIPVSAAKNELEVELLCHYLNLQPLWASDNVSKSASYCENHKKRKFAMIRGEREHTASRAST